MAYSVSTVGNYTKENADQLWTAAVMGGKTVSIMKSKGNVMVDVKFAEKLGKIVTDAVFQANACGWAPSATTTISQRTLTVGAIMVQEALCQVDLEKKFIQQALPAGSDYNELVFEEEYVKDKNARIQYELEKMVWQGDTNSGNATLSKADGFIKLIDAETTFVAANARRGVGTITSTTGAATVTGVSTTFLSQVAVGDKIYSGSVLIGTVLTVGSDTSITLTANGAAAVSGAAYRIVPVAASNSLFFGTPILATTGITTTNVNTIVDGIYNAIPEAVLASQDQPVIFMGIDTARTYKLALKAANLYHYQADMNPTDGFMIPGLDILCQPVAGLSGTGRAYAIQPGNMFFGTDMINEEENYRLWWSQDNSEMRYKCAFKAGVQVAFPDQIVAFSLV